MIPDSGEVRNPSGNPALERYHRACNAYYDIFNNGGMNCAQAIRAYFGVATSRHVSHYVARSVSVYDWASVHRKTEPAMDAIILAAVAEQGIS